MISPAEWQRLEPILDAVLELAPEARAAFLDRACGQDRDLRRKVDTFLESCDTSGSFFEIDLTTFAAPLFQEQPGEIPDGDPLEPHALDPGATIGPFRILRRLGGGGMGEVYLALDSRLDREVALKVISSRHASDEVWKRRFHQEARAASSLDHPHIATIYEIGDAGGMMFIAMTYRGGGTLRDRIARGPLPVGEALDLARQIAAGLAAAHAAGLVHRDIKPENVIVTADGTVNIVDFGLMKPSGTEPARAGAIRGTVAYMSPEQTRGETVDARSDVWSLGVILYEMLSGVSPFQADSHESVINRIRRDDPLPLENLRPTVPVEVFRIVHGCLGKSPGERYANASSLEADLEEALRIANRGSASGNRRSVGWWPVGIGAIALAAVVAGVLVFRPGTQAPAARVPPAEAIPRAHWIAVLPMRNVGGSPDDAFLADGLSEELIAGLSQRRGLRVIAWSSVSSYREVEKRLSEVARDLGVGHVLEGSIRRSGEAVRVEVRLVEGSTGRTIWTEEYDATVSDLADVHRGIAERIASTLPLEPDPTGVAARGTTDPDAYLLYLRGRYVLAKDDPASMARAREYFDQALERDPVYAQAWSGLSDAFDRLAWSHALPPSEAYPRARAAAERALALNPELAEAHASLARAQESYYWDSEAAEWHFRRAIELDPSNARAHRGYSALLNNHGRLEEARREAELALTLDPVAFPTHFQMVLVSFFERRYDEAIERAQRLAGVGPPRSVGFMLAKARVEKEEYDAALADLDRIDTERRFPPALAMRGYIHGVAGRPDAARQMLGILSEMSSRGVPVAFDQAVVYYGLGESERAVELFGKAIEQRDWRVRLLKAEPMFEGLRGAPGYEALLVQAGFVE